MNRIKINELIVVEGKYDKIRLENIIDADIFVLNGFRIFKNKEMIATIKALAGDRNIIVLTDSDTAGYKIRVYLSKVLHQNQIINVFIPQIKGKEKRKTSPSAQGFVGVEGISDDVLLEALEKYKSKKNSNQTITVTDLYKLGFTGTDGAVERKNKLLASLGVQTNISNKFLLKILNDRFTIEEFKNFLKGGDNNGF